jgi:hypothetical protein
MKHRTAVNTLSTIVFIFGVLVGSVMHGHLSVVDIILSLFIGLVFYIMRVVSIGLMLKRLLVKNDGSA